MEESFRITMELDTSALALQVADAGARIVSDIYRHANQVHKADQRIKDVATQVNLVSEAAKTLSQLLDDPTIRALRRDEAVTTAEETIAACQDLFDEMLACLAKFHTPWPFKHMTIEVLSARMSRLKGTLELLLSVLRFARLNSSGAASREESEGLMQRLESLIQEYARSVAQHEEVIAVSGSPAQSSGEDGHSVISHLIPILVEHPNTTGDALRPPSPPEQLVDTGDRSFEMDTVKEEGQAPAHEPRPDDASQFCPSDLDKCIGHIRYLLRLSEALQQSEDGKQTPQDLTAEYMRVRKALDSIILGDEDDRTHVEDDRTPASRRQSFQIAPVKAYLRRAKYSWKDWFLLSSIIKGKKEHLGVPELHDGKHCPFPGCQAHAKASPQEKQLFGMPTTPPNEQAHPAAVVGLLGPAPCPLPNLSLTTIYTDGDDTSSCRSCSERESVSSVSPINEKAPGVPKDAVASPAQPMPVFEPKVPRSAQDALRMWTTVLD